MLIEETVDKLVQMKFKGMVEAFRKALEEPAWRKLSFPERFALIVEEEWRVRKERARARRLKEATFRHLARLEEVIVKKWRGLEKETFIELSQGRWFEQHRPILLTGPTGSGKTYLACALGEKACREGRRVKYWRTGRLLEEFRLSRLEGRWMKLLAKLARYDLVILDDWGTWDLTETGRRDLLEIIEDRSGLKSTVVSTQVPINAWHELLGGDTIADSILDRLVHGAIRIDLKTKESLRGTDRKEQAA